MDTITHALIGATLAHACQSEKKHQQQLKLSHRVSLGALAAAFPDIDYLSYLIDPLSFISDWHRAETHSLILLPLWALLLAYIFTKLTHQAHRLKEATLICCLSLASHIAADLITSWGTQVFAPLSSKSYAWGTSFVIDPYLSGIVMTGLLLGLLIKKPCRDKRFVTRTALLSLSIYMAFQLTLKIEASNIAKQQIIVNQWQDATIYTMPQPFSPLHWKIIISSDENYYLSYISLADRTYLPFLPETFTAMIQHYRPADSLNWKIYSRYGNTPEKRQIKNAWLQPEFERYRRFASLPATYKLTESSEEVCYWFLDLRFTLPGIQPSFIYGACQSLNRSQQWSVRPYKSNTK